MISAADHSKAVGKPESAVVDLAVFLDVADGECAGLASGTRLPELCAAVALWAWDSMDRYGCEITVDGQCGHAGKGGRSDGRRRVRVVLGLLGDAARKWQVV